MKILENKKAQERLQHVISHYSSGWINKPERKDFLCNRIVLKEDNFYTCFRSLQGYCDLKLIYDWFHNPDVNAVRHLCYNYSKLFYVCSQPPYSYYDCEELFAYENMAWEGVWFLLSNHVPLIKEYAKLDQLFGKQSNNPNSPDFYTKQFFVALRGDWKELKQRCETILANPPKSGRGKQYMLDHKFYLGLANGDVQGMQKVIDKMLEPKVMGRRKSYESGYTKDLICTPVLLYLKLALYHGYELQVDNPYIPNEWLPMTPLDEYVDEFDFMKNYKI
ncbi:MULTISPECIES: hypothetical protein [Pasteurellaceae]|uniref:hypothetical protein n=1 Tax=Pasteurellaceae TaxID=712 RepID=UPI00276B5729|nr:hypothetical protein [Pasteurella atlantica]MDP8038850.1 hypothetical protein [Pasteurella atlantica]MDP8045263.1 hypothetical protein [Pasteurella atlantica]